jgi:hypothetical protein
VIFRRVAIGKRQLCTPIPPIAVESAICISLYHYAFVISPEHWRSLQWPRVSSIHCEGSYWIPFWDQLDHLLQIRPIHITHLSLRTTFLTMGFRCLEDFEDVLDTLNCTVTTLTLDLCYSDNGIDDMISGIRYRLKNLTELHFKHAAFFENAWLLQKPWASSSSLQTLSMSRSVFSWDLLSTFLDNAPMVKNTLLHECYIYEFLLRPVEVYAPEKDGQFRLLDLGHMYGQGPFTGTCAPVGTVELPMNILFSSGSVEYDDRLKRVSFLGLTLDRSFQIVQNGCHFDQRLVGPFMIIQILSLF